jgi:hypothetical protein
MLKTDRMSLDDLLIKIDILLKIIYLCILFSFSYVNHYNQIFGQSVVVLVYGQLFL